MLLRIHVATDPPTAATYKYRASWIVEEYIISEKIVKSRLERFYISENAGEGKQEKALHRPENRSFLLHFTSRQLFPPTIRSVKTPVF